MEHLLRPGFLLDERYRVERVLGEGGFGITYAAENIRLGLRVAIKELFWRDHSARDVSLSPEVTLPRPRDAAVFAAQKERFLREARTLRDFASLPGIAHVLDYFEENGTAYIVMEYVEGETLGSLLAREGGRMEAQALLRRALPLVESPGKLHAVGVIHRDISPDNIMAQPDGALRLIDFGAARQIVREDGRDYTTIGKVSYAPAEQYDKNGRQGPWTDVYALCATLYHCLSGAPPESAVQRLFLDEPPTPSQLGAPVAPEIEAILMKGLEVQAARRYQSMEELGAAIRAVLPEEKAPAGGGRRAALLGFAAGLACLAIVLGLLLYRQYAAANRFRGVRTKRLRVTANETMTAAEFAEGQQAVRRWLEEFAGHDNYLMRVEGAAIDITLPLDIYAGREIFETSVHSFNAFTGNAEGDKPMHLDAQIQCNWEDPETSLTPGEHQARPDVFGSETLLLGFAPGRAVTRGARANIILDLKTRLDALGTPYAFGTLYGDDETFVIRISPERVGRFLLDTLGEAYPLYLAGEYRLAQAIHCGFNKYEGKSPISVLEEGGLPRGLRYGQMYDFATDLEDLTRVLLENGEDTVYLQSDEGISIAEAHIDGVVTSGELSFDTLCLTDQSEVTPENAWALAYVDALLNQTSLPESCYLRFQRVADARGELLFGAEAEDYYGLFVRVMDGELRLQETLDTLEAETGYAWDSQWASEGYSRIYWVHLDLAPDADLAARVAEVVPELIARYGLGSFHGNNMLSLQLVREQGEERCRLNLHTSYDYDTGEIYTRASLLVKEAGRLAPYAEELRAWWEKLDVQALGLRKQ